MAERSLKNPIGKKEVNSEKKKEETKKSPNVRKEARKSKDGLPQNKEKSAALPDQKKKNTRQVATGKKSDSNIDRRTSADKNMDSSRQTGDRNKMSNVSENKESSNSGHMLKTGRSQDEPKRSEGDKSTILTEHKLKSGKQLTNEKKSDRDSKGKSLIEKKPEPKNLVRGSDAEQTESKISKEEFLKNKEKLNALVGQAQDSNTKLTTEKQSDANIGGKALVDKNSDSSRQVNGAPVMTNRTAKEPRLSSLQMSKGKDLPKDLSPKNQNGEKGATAAAKGKNGDFRNEIKPNESSVNLNSGGNVTNSSKGVTTENAKLPAKDSNKNDRQNLEKDGTKQTQSTAAQKGAKKAAEETKNRKQSEITGKASGIGKEAIEKSNNGALIGDKKLKAGESSDKNERNKATMGNTSFDKRDPEEQEGQNYTENGKMGDGNHRPMTYTVADNETTRNKIDPSSRKKCDERREDKPDQGSLKFPPIVQGTATDSRMNSEGRGGTFTLEKVDVGNRISEPAPQEESKATLPKSTVSEAKPSKANGNTSMEIQAEQRSKEPKIEKQFGQGGH